MWIFAYFFISMRIHSYFRYYPKFELLSEYKALLAKSYKWMYARSKSGKERHIERELENRYRDKDRIFINERKGSWIEIENFAYWIFGLDICFGIAPRTHPQQLTLNSPCCCCCLFLVCHFLILTKLLTMQTVYQKTTYKHIKKEITNIRARTST